MLQSKGKDTKVFKKLSDEIDRKFDAESLLGIARKGNIEELYFCVTLPTEEKQQKTAVRINDALNLPLDYDQLENGRRTKFIAIALDELQEIIDRVEISPKHSAKQKTKIKTIDESDRKNSTKSDRTKIPTTDTPQIQPVKREEWEKQMLKQAIACLKANSANAGEEMQTATFGDGKYRVIHHTPSQMLRIVDEENYRGTLYKVQRGKAAQVCEFTSEEKKSFELSKVKLDTHLENSTLKGLQRE